MDTYIYIDGFNLYYRALKKTPYKWLDLKRLSQNLLSKKNSIVKMKYFTAKVSGIFDSRQPIRQKTYIRALQKFIPDDVLNIFLWGEITEIKYNKEHDSWRCKVTGKDTEGEDLVCVAGIYEHCHTVRCITVY